MKNNKILFITKTAIFLAILLVLQYSTKMMGQFVTGSMVNFVLIATTLLAGVYSGVTVALVSPFLAFMLGIGPAFIQVIPIVALGNVVLVLAYNIILRNINIEKGFIKWVVAIISAAILKFLVLYFGIVKIALPIIPNLKEKQIAIISASFSWPQLVTAAIGGAVALAVIPLIRKALIKAK